MKKKNYYEEVIKNEGVKKQATDAKMLASIRRRLQREKEVLTDEEIDRIVNEKWAKICSGEVVKLILPKYNKKSFDFQFKEWSRNGKIMLFKDCLNFKMVSVNTKLFLETIRNTIAGHNYPHASKGHVYSVC